VPTSALPNEFRLLVACSWAPPEPLRSAQRAEMERLCRAGVDWAAFLALVRRHQVPALVVQAFERGDAAGVPAVVWSQLRQSAAQARLRSLMAAAECGRIARALAAAGIEALSLKGGPLSATLYGDPVMRHTRDVDILVREWQAERTGNVLTALGYHPPLPAHRTTPRLQAMLRGCADSCTYRHPRLPVSVDLHWDQELWTPAQLDELWQQSMESHCFGAPMRMLSGDMLLVYLCDHGTKHRWSRVKWLSDIAMLLTRPRSRPWEELFDLTQRLEATGALSAATLLVHSLYGLPLPPALREFAEQEATAPALVAEARRALQLSHEEPLNTRLEPWFWAKLQSQRLRRPSLRLSAHLSRRLIHAGDLVRFPLPDSLLWLHYLIRPLSWLWRLYRSIQAAEAPQLPSEASTAGSAMPRKQSTSVWVLLGLAPK
jgi:predicted nucleic acid-binding protein